MTTQLVRYEAARTALADSNITHEKPPAKPGVYALFKDGECMYVGESTNMKKRLQKHERRTQVPGCEIRFHACDEHKQFEKLLIKDLLPVKNGISPATEIMQARASEKHSLTSLEDRIESACVAIFGEIPSFLSCSAK